MSICVIGAGIIGTSTAIRIQELDPTVKVTIISATFSPDTTSDVAAGLWLPHLMGSSQDQDLIRKWGIETFDRMASLYRLDGSYYGVGLESGYILSDSKLSLEGKQYEDILLHYKELNSDEVRRLGFPKVKYGEFFTSYYLESRKYIPALLKQFEAKGGTIIRRKLNSIHELASYSFDTIVNCSGVGASHLFNDKQVFPIRGQLLRVHAPFIKQFYVFDIGGKHHYLLQNNENQALGGTEQRGNWDLTPDPKDSMDIWNEIVTYLPSLKAVKGYTEAVGLRPGRPTVRLEMDHLRIGSRRVPVVHNYGHGGSGISLHWGCAKDAATLAVNAVRQEYKKSKL